MAMVVGIVGGDGGGEYNMLSANICIAYRLSIMQKCKTP